MRQRYRKKAEQTVVALQLDLQQLHFTYRKWGGQQVASSGDWLVNNDGDVYTVEQQSFARTYQRVSTGLYIKTTPIWAEPATQAGAVTTKEGVSNYVAGDYLVSNEESGDDAYCVSATKFASLYELDE